MRRSPTFQMLVKSHGFILSAGATAKVMGFGSTDALRFARIAGRLPIQMFLVEGRRGWFASAEDVATKVGRTCADSSALPKPPSALVGHIRSRAVTPQGNFDFSLNGRAPFVGLSPVSTPKETPDETLFIERINHLRGAATHQITNTRNTFMNKNSHLPYGRVRRSVALYGSHPIESE